MIGARGRRSVEEEYARLASVYDERWAAYIAASIELTTSRLPSCARFSRILDVGCGTGALLAPLAARYASAALFGVDASLAMLKVAKSKRSLVRAALFAGKAEALPFRDARFDLLTSTSALHYFGDIEGAIAEMHRVVAPGGRVLITDWCSDYLTVRVFDGLMRALRRASFTVLGSADCERLLRRAGFDEITVEKRRISALWGLMAVRACKRG